MSGDIRTRTAMNFPPSEGFRSLGNGRQSPTSPLKHFGRAKKKINDVYTEIASYVQETNTFFKSIEDEDDLVTKEQLRQLASYIDRVKGIQEIIGRDRMKVVFFGRTSNGKSTVVNAMLRAKILPTGIGHTTHCFLQVEGTDAPDAYLIQGDSEIQQNVQNVGQLAHALSNTKIDSNTLIRICWPKENCSLLKDDVVLLDSPGIDVTPDLDSWIDSFCLDADVFVLVANAESTLMQTEKKFFHKVSDRLSAPNVFILNNRWDASAAEPELSDEVKAQHLERNVHFLVEELGVVGRHEAEERVYFVSAREALVSRTHKEGTPTPSGTLLEGYQGRLFEFAGFEAKFQECISQSAVQTKFAQHTGNGKSIIGDCRGVVERVWDNAAKYTTQCSNELDVKQEQLSFTEKQLNNVTNDIKDKIRFMTDEVEKKVSSALTEEIRRLAVLVEEFERPFHPDAMMVSLYKKDLHQHVEQLLSLRIQDRCSTALKTTVEAAQAEMKERVSELLPEAAREASVNIAASRDFEPAYRLDCKNLCADFQEDIQFRFSLGITSLMNRFLGRKGTQAALSGFPDTVPRPLSSVPQTPSNEANPEFQDDQNQMLLSILANFTNMYSRSSVGALAITGLIAKAAGWRVLAVLGSVYGLLYVYERLTWTNKAKERAFKRQYVAYATSKLRLIIDLTSSNCSHQVQQELSGTFARLCRLVDNTKSELETDIDGLREELSKLEKITARAKVLKNKAGYLDTELNTFIHEYLKPESQL